MTETDYDLDDLYEAYREAISNGSDMFAPWSLFTDAYGDNADRHFLNAVDNGDIEIYETEPGIRADGSWPRYNTGRLWLDFNF